jgi:hypothetical protein
VKAEIIIDPTGRGNIRIDGQDVSKAVRGFQLESRVGEVTTLVLDLVMVRAEIEVDTVIVPQTYDLLVRLGWTPPEGQR